MVDPHPKDEQVGRPCRAGGRIGRVGREGGSAGERGAAGSGGDRAAGGSGGEPSGVRVWPSGPTGRAAGSCGLAGLSDGCLYMGVCWCPLRGCPWCLWVLACAYGCHC